MSNISENDYFSMINNIKNDDKKPVYEYSRDNNGDIKINSSKKDIPTLEEINNNIVIKSMDDKEKMMDKMLQEMQDNLTRYQIEIDILDEMYHLFNKDIYLKQINSYKDRKVELINKIRILKSLKEKYNAGKWFT